MKDYYRCKKGGKGFTEGEVYPIWIDIDFEVYYISKDDQGKQISVDPDRFKRLSDLEAQRHLTIQDIIATG